MSGSEGTSPLAAQGTAVILMLHALLEILLLGAISAALALMLVSNAVSKLVVAYNIVHFYNTYTLCYSQG